MEKEQRRVIVCGSADCDAEVRAVCSSIAQDPLLSHHFTAINPQEPSMLDLILDLGLLKNDIFVLLLGDRYGNAVCEGKSLTEHFFDCATDAGLLRLVFVKTTDKASWRQLEFANKINCLIVRKRFLNPEEAVAGVRIALETVILGHEKAEGKRPMSNEELMNAIFEKLTVPLTRIEGGMQELRAHVTAEADREIAAKAPRHRRKFGHEGNGLRGPRTPKMVEQRDAFFAFLKEHPEDAKNSRISRAHQLWNKHPEWAKAAKAEGDKKGYASHKALAQAQ